MNVCFESNIIDVSYDTWWLDSGATIHACNYMQAMISIRSPTSLEQYVYMEDDIRNFSIRNFLGLQDVSFIPSIRRNLISIPILDRFGYSFPFGIGKLNCIKIHY